ncbi:CoA transferase [Frankia canadensis]|uniref:CoA transferase n=1 Tax=Frankia canadensis TaxID=1836972 RepID=UPI001FAEF42B|nr:CoA transferase [Frankia canadensis]
MAAPAPLADAPSPDPLDELGAVLTAQGLLETSRGLVAARAVPAGPFDDAPALAWAQSGLMWLTGQPRRAPLAPGAPVLGRAVAAARLFASLAGQMGHAVVPDVPSLLGGRAALMGLRRAGRTSANGSCRLLRTADDWIAVNLARPADVEAIDALVGVLGQDVGAGTSPACPDPRAQPGAQVTDQAWQVLDAAVRRLPAGEVADMAHLLAIPASVLRTGRRPSPVRRVAVPGARPGGPVGSGHGGPLVVDLSAMWAGPLCARLLGQVGMRVIKVESARRPDGARQGDPDFYDWLHEDQRSVALDFESESGRARLHRLVDEADVVIESSRPRALEQLGLDAARAVAVQPGKVWLSITGYGRGDGVAGRGAQPVSFGDDAAVGGGLVAWERSGAAASPVFCGDAIADPLTGLFAALAVVASLARGGGSLLDVPLRDVSAWVADSPSAPRGHRPPPWQVTGSDEDGWMVAQAGRSQRVLPPRAPWVDGAGHEVRPRRAPSSGAHTQAVLEELGPR